MGPLRSVTGGAQAALHDRAEAIRAAEDRDRPVVSASYGRRDYWERRFLALADTGAIALALLAAGLAGYRDDLGTFLLWGTLTLPVWLVIFKAYGLYDRDMKRVSHTTIDDIPWVFHGLLVGGLLLWAFYKWSPAEQLVLPEMMVFGAAAVLSMLGLRAGVRRLAPALLGRERVALLGDGPTTNLVSKMRAHPEYRLDPVGLISRGTRPAQVPLLPVMGDLDQVGLEQIVARHGIDRVVLSHTELGEDEMLELLRTCRQLGVKVSILPQLFDVMGPSVEIDDVEGMTVLGINPPVLPRSSRFLKRTLDLVASTATLLVAAPLLACIALAIKVGSRGPVFFRQERIGKNGRHFKLVKFRTMVRDAERLTAELHAQSSDPNWLKLERDPRITRVGRFLRLSSLDEVPELWNVLKGEMSLVGPRPLSEQDDRQVGGWGRHRLDLTPGVTGLWQVLGRTDIPFAEMIKLDYLYVTNWSLWGDIRLILRTLPVVLTRRGAN